MGELFYKCSNFQQKHYIENKQKIKWNRSVLSYDMCVDPVERETSEYEKR